MFPDPDDGPPCDLETLCGVTISRDVRPQLDLPPFSVPRRPRRMLRASVPKAAVDEDCDLSGCKEDVGPSPWHPWQRSVHSVPVPEAVQRLPERHLSGGVTSSLPRHPQRGRRVDRRSFVLRQRAERLGWHMLIMLRGRAGYPFTRSADFAQLPPHASTTGLASHLTGTVRRGDAPCSKTARCARWQSFTQPTQIARTVSATS